MCFSAECRHYFTVLLKFSSNIIPSFNLYASWIIIMTYMQMQLRVLIYANYYNFKLNKYFSNPITRVMFFKKWLPTASYGNLLKFKILVSHIYWDGKATPIFLQPFVRSAAIITVKPGWVVREIHCPIKWFALGNTPEQLVSQYLTELTFLLPILQ